MEQTNIPKVTNWIEEEVEELSKKTNFDGEKLPALKFEQNKTTAFKVDFSEKFREWKDPTNGSVKAIIPIEHKGEKKVLWLNKANPLYSNLIISGRTGQTEFKVIQIGSQADTKYQLLED